MAQDDRVKVIVEPTADRAIAFAANLFTTIICESVSSRGRCMVALAGGTTPHALYQLLAGNALSDEVPWSDVEIFFGDERDVPADHAESNYGMAQRTLLDHVPVPPDQVHPMRGDADDLSAAAHEYEKTVRQIVTADGGGIPAFDLILLGMGGDGHTASLFPNTAVVNEQEKLVAANDVPVLGRTRLTFTFPLINAARNVLLLVTGDDKAPAVADLLGDDPARKLDLPVSRVSPAGQLMMVFDAAAARRSSGTRTV